MIQPSCSDHVPCPHSSQSHLQLSLVVFILPGEEVDLLQELLLVMLQLTHAEQHSRQLLAHAPAAASAAPTAVRWLTLLLLLQLLLPLRRGSRAEYTTQKLAC